MEIFYWKYDHGDTDYRCTVNSRSIEFQRTCCIRLISVTGFCYKRINIYVTISLEENVSSIFGEFTVVRKPYFYSCIIIGVPSVYSRNGMLLI